ncbi:MULTISPECIES: ribulose-phosphate 3-epimerase [unclassified Lactobacillus]|uniref:ribulose-phosphate 3-epimerase n=1 Tax=unclassified Lactobacillus TaxID=2620435 RepID=UPI000EFC8054|nr:MULTISPECIES: ribulose-phosphate 3-epimerase [unclassified Lactobacillus]RMC23872.1 ribulose-phosphate 3-epimerase [Lactobacillus sp. ESL0247]RMC27616.1 ribulose-phosphate 3-epimerase [Lactobacillus sp. ESL0246]RMC30896.1 ribulose-phosphate 3-epimerase [Lactobacillus sp. ESL0245]
MKRLLCPSMMCANLANIKSEVTNLIKAGVDIFHMDIMDGDFVPNFALGLEDYKAIRSLTSLPMDAHLMVKNPNQYINLFSNAGADIIYIHPEADPISTSTLLKIKSLGKHPGIAINPGTSIETIKELLPLADYVMVMTVNPGFAGQKFLDFVIPKIKNLAQQKQEKNFTLMVDGAISPGKIKELSTIGVDGFILGTSSLFGKQENYLEIIKKLRGE